jgi:hypothetical protein
MAQFETPPGLDGYSNIQSGVRGFEGYAMLPSAFSGRNTELSSDNGVDVKVGNQLHLTHPGSPLSHENLRPFPDSECAASFGN